MEAKSPKIRYSTSIHCQSIGWDSITMSERTNCLYATRIWHVHFVLAKCSATNIARYAKRHLNIQIVIGLGRIGQGWNWWRIWILNRETNRRTKEAMGAENAYYMKFIHQVHLVRRMHLTTFKDCEIHGGLRHVPNRWSFYSPLSPTMSLILDSSSIGQNLPSSTLSNCHSLLDHYESRIFLENLNLMNF